MPPPMAGMPVHLQAHYDALDRLVRVTGKYSVELQNLSRKYMNVAAEGQKLAEEYKKMERAGGMFMRQWEQHGKLSLSLIKSYQTHAKSLQDLKAHYDKLAVAQKILDVAQKSTTEKVKMATDALGKMSGGTIGLVAKLTTLSLSYSHLSTTLLQYNRAVFDGMRVGERYGDSMEKFDRALTIVRRGTALSKQEFADLNLSIKQMSVGLPMTSEAVAKLAESLSTKLGWSADKVGKSITALLPLQNKLPSLFDRITKAQNGTAASAKALVDKLYAIGASRQEIEGVLDAISQPKFDFKKWMGFEETIAKSKRDIKDVNLEIANKMKSGLEMVAKIQAGIAKMVGALPSSIMLAVGAFALMGVEVGKVLTKLVSIQASLAAMSGAKGLTGTAAAGGQAFFGGGSWKGMGMGLGAAALVVGGDIGSRKLEDWATSGYDPSKGDPSKNNRWKAAGAGAASKALAWGTAGTLMGKGKTKLIFGGAAATIGGIYGGVEGWMRGGDAASAQQAQREDYLAQKGAGTSTMGLAAKTAGISVRDGASREEILAAAKKETDLKKQVNFLEAAYSQGLIRRKDIEDTIAKTAGGVTEQRKKADEIITSSISGLSGMFEEQRKIERAVEGMTQELETQLGIYRQLGDAGKNAVASFQEGMLGSDVGMTLAQTGLQAQQQAATAAGRQAVLAYVKAFSDDPRIKEKLNIGQQINAAALTQSEASIKAAALKLDGIRAQMEAASSGKTGKDKDAAEAPFRTQLEAGGKELDRLKGQLADIEKTADFSSVLGVGDAQRGIAEINDKISKLREEQAKMSADGEAGSQAYKDISEQVDHLTSQHAIMVQHMEKYAQLVGGPIAQAFAANTMESRRQVSLQEQLLSLNESRLALAEKMGMPQSYRALKDQVQLTYQQYQNYEKIYSEQDKVVKGLEEQFHVAIDYKAVLNNTKSIEQVLAETKTEAVKQGTWQLGAEESVVQAILKQADAANKMVQTEGKLAELTKTWREGWMDAMEETVINAGDFAAVLAVGDKNRPEAIAAGGLSTWKHGAVNDRALDAYTMQQLRNDAAPRYTNQWGVLNNIQNPSPLMRYSPAGQNVYQNGQGVAAAMAGTVPMYPDQNAPGQAWSGDIFNQAINQSASGSIQMPNAGPMQPGAYFNASNKPFGPSYPLSGTPGSPAQFRLPDQSSAPFADAGTKMYSAADKFSTAVDHMGQMFNVKTGALQSRGGGGIIRAAQGIRLPASSPMVNQRAADSVVTGDSVKTILKNPKEILEAYKLEKTNPKLFAQKYPSLVNSKALKQSFRPGVKQAGIALGMTAASYYDDWTRSHGTDNTVTRTLGSVGKGASVAGDLVSAVSGSDKYGTSANVANIAAGLTIGSSWAGLSFMGGYGLGNKLFNEEDAPMGSVGRGAQRFWQRNVFGGQTRENEITKRVYDKRRGVHNAQLQKMWQSQELEALKQANTAKQRKTWGELDIGGYAKRGGFTPEQLTDIIANQETKLTAGPKGEENWRTSNSKKEFPEMVLSSQKIYESTKRELEAAQKSGKEQIEIEKLKDRLNSAMFERTRDLAIFVSSRGGLFKSENPTNGTTVQVPPAPAGGVRDAAAIKAAEDAAFANSQAIEAGLVRGGVNSVYGHATRPKMGGWASGTTHRRADGGILPGSYVVKASAASANAGVLNDMGAGWVTGGVPGKDSVLFGVGGGMAGGGSPSGTSALLMPGEAVVPPEFAHIGEAINNGIAQFAKGGVLPDESAMRDILMATGGGGRSTTVSGGGGGGTVTIDLSPQASELLRFQGRSDYANGSTP